MRDGCYQNGLFLFAFRYFEVAEMFGREDQTAAKHEKNRAVTRKISYVGLTIITLNFLICFSNYGVNKRVTTTYDTYLNYWTYLIMP